MTVVHATTAPEALVAPFPPRWERHLRTFKAGETIAPVGLADRKLHLVRNGWACRSVTLRDGQRQILSVLLPGDVSGLRMSNGAVSPTSLVAISPCEVMIVPQVEAMDDLAKDEELADLLWTAVRRQEMIQEQHLVSLGRRTALERTAHFLCEVLMRRAGPDGETCDLPFTQVQLADLMGLSVVHVHRVVQTLKRLEKVEITRGELTTRDLKGLRKVAGFDPFYLEWS